MHQNIPGNDVDLRDFCRPPARRARLEHDEHVMQMNEVHRCASARVQRATHNVASVIDEPGASARPSRDPR
jgi:hypothetical protein